MSAPVIEHDQFSCIISKVTRRVMKDCGTVVSGSFKNTVKSMLGVGSLEGFTHVEQMNRLNKAFSSRILVVDETYDLKRYLRSDISVEDYVSNMARYFVPICYENGILES